MRIAVFWGLCWGPLICESIIDVGVYMECVRDLGIGVLGLRFQCWGLGFWWWWWWWKNAVGVEEEAVVGGIAAARSSSSRRMTIARRSSSRSSSSSSRYRWQL